MQTNNLADFKELISVFEVVFEMNDFQAPEDSHLQRVLNNENFLVFIARADEKIVGGLTVYVLDQYYSEKPLAYIYDLAVLTDCQRKGVGRKLIAFTNDYCRSSGFQEVFVQADKIDDYAIEFYRKTLPAIEEETVQFSYDLLK